MQTKEHARIVGRANTVLVFGEGENAAGVITAITAMMTPLGRRRRVTYSGEVTFDQRTKRHIARVVLPLVEAISDRLDLPRRNFAISGVNVGAASVIERGLHISGFSADVPTFLAMLSATLQIPVSSGIVSTGHVASRDGDIRMVRNLGVKAKTAARDPSIRAFVHPAINADISIRQLAPAERERAAAELAKAKLGVTAIAIRDVKELLLAVFDDEALAEGALRAGFYGRELTERGGHASLEEVGTHLVENGERRFMGTLERYLLSGDAQRVHRLLDLWVHFHVNEGKYPRGFGGMLRSLVSGLPPAVRRLKIKPPLLDPNQCRQLSLLASEADFEDLQHLYVQNPGPNRAVRRESTMEDETISGDTGAGMRSLDTVLSEIDPERLAEVVGHPIDSARAGYVMDSVIVSGHEEFMDTICAFYLHVLRHTGVVSGPAETTSVGPEAIALLEKAFAKNGGTAGALVEAMTGTHGGMRHVLDVMTEQHKMEQQEKYVLSVFNEAVDPMDWDAKVHLMKAFLRRHGGDLPSEITSEPPERYAREFEPILRTYVRSISPLKQLLRAL